MAQQLRDKIPGDLRSLRTEGHIELKQANIAYTDCVTKSFLPGWLKGESLQVNEVCGSQYDDMMEKQAAIYGESPMPFQTLKLPAAQL